MTQEQIIVEVLKKHKIIKYKGLFRDCMLDAMNEYARQTKDKLDAAKLALEEIQRDKTFGQSIAQNALRSI
jgi:hypothetical protein